MTDEEKLHADVVLTIHKAHEAHVNLDLAVSRYRAYLSQKVVVLCPARRTACDRNCVAICAIGGI